MSSRFENAPKVRPVRSKTKTLTVVNPIFLTCAEITEQRFWKDLFTNLAHGKCTRGVRLGEHDISIRRKNKVITQPFTSDAVETEQLVREFLQSHNILSSEDKRIKLEKANEALAPSREEVYTTFSKIRGQGKIIEIQNYTLEMQKLMNLTVAQRRDLQDMILLGVSNGVFNNTTIHMQDGLISRIDGLGFNPETGRFYIDTTLPVKKTRSSGSGKVQTVDFFIEQWKKYCATSTARSRATPTAVPPDSDMSFSADHTETGTQTRTTTE